MNPILQVLNSHSNPFNGNTEDAKKQVLGMISRMAPQQRSNFNSILPIIGKIAQSKGVDISQLSELTARS